MNIYDYFYKTLFFLTMLSKEYGTGDLYKDVTTICIVILAIALFCYVVARILNKDSRNEHNSKVYTDKTNTKSGGGINYPNSIEGCINDLKRNISLLQNDLEVAKDDIEVLKKIATTLLTESNNEQNNNENQINSGIHSLVAPNASLTNSGSRRIVVGSKINIADSIHNNSSETSGIDDITKTNMSFGSGSLTLNIPNDNTSTDSLLKKKDDDELDQRLTSVTLKRLGFGFFTKIKTFLGSKQKISRDSLEEFESLLISTDIGVKTTTHLINILKDNISKAGEIDKDKFTEILKEEILKILEPGSNVNTGIYPQPQPDGPMVVMVVGVNGAGKTTTVAKLASMWKDSGFRVMMVAADTFRAAAVEQLQEWGTRAGITVISGKENSKPSTVIYEAIAAAKRNGVDVLIVDTAGRLHNKSNLMQELEGMKNIMRKSQPLAPHETILVIDGTSGQNALIQATEFNECTPLTGIIVTKLDGTPKGGIVVAIKQELGIPIRYIGIGEKVNDLKVFNSRDFINALIDE